MLLNAVINVWVYEKAVDMRKSIDGLSIIVASNMQKNPTQEGEIFLFYNRALDKVKTLYWDKNGFCLWYKRLEKGRFNIPKEIKVISYDQLRWLIDGLDISKLKGNCKLSYNKFY